MATGWVWLKGRSNSLFSFLRGGDGRPHFLFFGARSEQGLAA